MKIADHTFEVTLRLEDQTADLRITHPHAPGGAIRITDLTSNDCRNLEKLFKAAKESLELLPSVEPT